MKRSKYFLLIQSFLCILAAILLAGAAIGIYAEGTERKAVDPTAYIYTREQAVSAAVPGLIILIAGLGFSVVGGVMGIHDENDDKPAPADVYDGGMKQAVNDPHHIHKIRLAVLILAIICIIAGVANGNMKDILIKAINICTECVGLG